MTACVWNSVIANKRCGLTAAGSTEVATTVAIWIWLCGAPVPLFDKSGALGAVAGWLSARDCAGVCGGGLTGVKDYWKMGVALVDLLGEVW